jgi:hypothetical protein
MATRGGKKDPRVLFRWRTRRRATGAIYAHVWALILGSGAVFLVTPTHTPLIFGATPLILLDFLGYRVPDFFGQGRRRREAVA